MKSENYEKLKLTGLILTVVLFALFSIAALQEPTRMKNTDAEITKESILRGRELYLQQCTSCHGTRGEGGAGPALNSASLLTSATDTVLFQTVAAGRPGTIMPAWAQKNGGPLTDEEIRDVVSFLRAWEATAPVLETEEFVADAARGLALFNSSCFICHGEYGAGTDVAPVLNDMERLSKLDDDWYRAVIANGRPAKGMPTWGTVLSPNQIEDVIALLDAWRNGESVMSETSVSDLLNSALFAISQNDVEDTVFYLNRAEPLAFGDGLAIINDIQDMLVAGQNDDALTALAQLSNDWPLGDAVAGEELFAMTCASCHGAEGQGGVGSRLTDNTFIQGQVNSKLLKFILAGRAGTAMRGFDGRLTEQQIADLIAFLRTWQP